MYDDDPLTREIQIEDAIIDAMFENGDIDVIEIYDIFNSSLHESFWSNVNIYNYPLYDILDHNDHNLAIEYVFNQISIWWGMDLVYYEFQIKKLISEKLLNDN